MNALTETMELGELDFCVVDTETTGGRAATNRVIDIAIYHYRDGIILNKYQTLLNPGFPIPAWITMLTGIDDSMVKGAPRFSDVADEIRSFLGKGIFVAHNAGFDYSFIRCEFERLGHIWEAAQLCTVRLARHLLPELPSRSLGNLCEHLLIDIYDRHRASGDAEATVYVLKHLLQMASRNHNVQSWGDLEGFLSAGPLVLPKGFEPSFLKTLPEGPGAYVFKDATGSPICKGKCTNLRRRIRNYFKHSNNSKKSNLLRELAHSFELHS